VGYSSRAVQFDGSGHGTHEKGAIIAQRTGVSNRNLNRESTCGSTRPSGSSVVSSDPPRVGLDHLDALWFQVTGTVCNLRCTHCFISCAPDNHTLEFLDLDTVLALLDESVRWGVKEYYVTGGEPFMHRQLPEMLEAILALGPATVLTNATLMRGRVLERLARAERDSRYSLEVRVSIDGPNAATNDPIRGEGTFQAAMNGVRALLDHGFLPIITATRVWSPEGDETTRQAFEDVLRELGYDKPRIKILPSLRIGREAARAGGYGDDDRVTEEMMEGYDARQLLCSAARVVTNRGVHVCPILVDEEDSLLGETLTDAATSFPLRHQACYTCWLYGAICSNFGAIGEGAA